MAKSYSYKPLKLPKCDAELREFISVNKSVLMEHVLNSIEYSLNSKIPTVEIFSFKDTDFIVSLDQKNFKENVERLYKVFLSEEKYELCDRIKKINLKLNKKHEK